MSIGGKKIKTVLAALSAMAIPFIGAFVLNNSNAYAVHWADTGGGATGGGGIANCTTGTHRNTWGQCIGSSWIEYAYVDRNGNEITNADIDGDEGVGGFTIPSATSSNINLPGNHIPNRCGKAGRFWNLGYEVGEYTATSSKTTVRGYGYQKGTWNVGVVDTSGFPGAWRNFYVKLKNNDNTVGANINEIVSGWTTNNGYRIKAVKYGTMEEVHKEFIQAKANASDDSAMANTAWKDVGSFCAGVNELNGKFRSRSVVSYDGETSDSGLDGKADFNKDNNGGDPIEIDSGTSKVTVRFTHYISTDEKDSNYKSAGAWTEYTLKQTQYNAKTIYSNEKIKVEDMNDNVDDHYREKIYGNKSNAKVTVILDRGETVTVCQKISYSPKKFTYTRNSFDPTRSTSGGSSACITLHRKNDNGSNGTFYSQSTVTYNSTTSTGVLDGKSSYNGGQEVTLAANKSVAILRFRHYIAIDNKNKFGQNAATTATVEGSSGRKISLNDAGWISGTDGAKGKSMIPVKSNNNVAYFTQSVTLNQGETKTFCQAVTYTPKEFSIKSGNISYSSNTQGGSSACITIHRLKENESEQQNTLGCDHTQNYGNSAARSSVINFNRDSNYISTTTGVDASTATTYAKPGDEVRFQHEYCYGAQSVTGSRSFGASRTSSGASIPSNWFSINSSPTDAYLFDRSSISSLRNGISISGNNPQPSNVSSIVSGVQFPISYALRIYSPAGNVSNNYRCRAYWNESNSGKGYTYQIPGFSDNAIAASSCLATNVSKTAAHTDSRMKNSDVGRTVSQYLDWDYVEAWVNKKSSTSGSCGCADNSLSENNTSINSYSEARNTSNLNGEVSAYCSVSGSCNCSGEPVSCSTSYSSNISYRYPVSSNIYRHSVANRKTAEVKIPYNFMTEAESSLGNDVTGIVYAGETATPSFSVSITERINQLVSYADSYKTVTPSDTKIEMVAYTIQSGTGSDAASSALAGTTNWPNNNSVCDYFRIGLGAQCLLIDASSGALNPEGELNDIKTYNYEKTITVPDVEEGTKFCVAIGISHADSHGFPSSSVISSADGANSNSMGNTNPNWRISGSSCRTIAKKPNVQTWGGTYTNGGITTTTSHKASNSGLASTIVSSNNYVFGSWSDTFAIANGTVKSFASGAALGYNNIGGHYATTIYCDLTKITIANTNCSRASNASSGNAGISSINNNIAGLIYQLRSRYAADHDDKPGYKYYSGDVTLDSSTSDSVTGRLVIEVDGDVTIDENICYGSGTCRSGATSLYLSQRNSQSYDNLNALPQIIIIANGGANIYIRPNVTQIDAWLIADGGAVITCDAATPGSGGDATADDCNNTIMFNGPVFAKRLILNRTGGAFAGGNAHGRASANFDLASVDRTYNSSTGLPINSAYGSVTPAEIFNLRADVYLWAYAQANRLTQATTTYMRELAPRY